MAGRYFDQWKVGDRILHEIRRTVTETDNLLFSTLTHNPQPLHLDAEFAAKSIFGRILVNGTFTFSLMVGLTVYDTTLGTLVANLGYDQLRMPKPVFIGDTMRAESEVTQLRESQSRPNTGIATFEHKLLNQRDEIVCQCLPAFGDAQQGARMRLRSLLFVPGDRPERMEKALLLGADALILDLEDSVALVKKAQARTLVTQFLERSAGQVVRFVRINPLASGLAEADLEAVMAAAPDGLVLPKSEGAQSVRDLDRQLAALGLTAAKALPKVLPIATETPSAVFALGTYREVADRLHGMSWGAEDLSAAVGAVSARDSDETYTAPYQLVRSLALFGAAAAGVAPIETVFPAFQNLTGLAQYARRGMRDGFAGMLAIHPGQIAVINDAFTPTPESLAHARAVVALFEANPGAGALSLEGSMVDAPHLKQAIRLLRQAHG